MNLKFLYDPQVSINKKTYVEGATYRFTSDGGGKVRISYHPSWDQTLPWVIYIGGTAVAHRGTLGCAKDWVKTRWGIACDCGDALNPNELLTIS